jgi:hypothetical protein
LGKLHPKNRVAVIWVFDKFLNLFGGAASPFLFSTFPVDLLFAIGLFGLFFVCNLLEL